MDTKSTFKVNDIISGECVSVPDPDFEPVDYYKVSKLKLITRSTSIINTSSPWELVSPELEVYRERGHRRLAVRTYSSKCSSYMCCCRMPVEIIVDNWNPSVDCQVKLLDNLQNVYNLRPNKGYLMATIM